MHTTVYVLCLLIHKSLDRSTVPRGTDERGATLKFNNTALDFKYAPVKFENLQVTLLACMRVDNLKRKLPTICSYTVNSAKNHTRFIDRSAGSYTTIMCLHVPLHHSTVPRCTKSVGQLFIK